MPFFDDFLQEELDLIISVPYCVGVWVGMSDDVKDSARDDAREQRALQAVLGTLAKAAKKKPFVAAVAEQALSHKNLWPRWRKNAANTPDNAARAMRLVAGRLPAENVRNYRSALLQIGTVVAQAYDEMSGPGDDLSGEMMLGGLVSGLLDRFSETSDPAHVSAAERAALQKLAQALQT